MNNGFELHPKAEEKFNQDALNLIPLIYEKDLEETEEEFVPTGSSAEKFSIGEINMSDRPMVLSNTVDEENVDVFEVFADRETGFNEINYLAFKRLVLGLYKIKSLYKTVTYKFLHTKAFEWVLAVYKNKKAETPLITYIKEEVIKVTGTYKYSFKVLNLDIEREFRIGNVCFEFMKDEYFDKFRGQTPEQLKGFREKLQGHVFATHIVKNVQKEKGTERALEECFKAMNVLKLYCLTVYKPQIRTAYDIDHRVPFVDVKSHIIENMNVEELNITFTAGARPFQLETSKINAIFIKGAKFIELIVNQEPNELQLLVLNGMEKFAEAISYKDLHKRIVDLFTIWESLLLKNDSVNIQDSLILYGSSMLNLNTDEKANFAALIMRMYDIRSQIVHHANKKDLNLNDVALLQEQTVDLMDTYLFNGEFPNKLALLEGIDQYLGTSVEQYTAERKKLEEKK